MNNTKLLKILTAKQCRDADAFTIVREPVTPFNLMERAAAEVFNYIVHHFENITCFTIICGTGNNGGDGLAVARMLSETGKQTEIFLAGETGHSSVEFRENYEKIISSDKIKLMQVKNAADIKPCSADALVIDALFGTGLSKPLTGFMAEIVLQINRLPHSILSIDLPSGLPADPEIFFSEQKPVVVKANYTITFQSPKLTQLLAGSGDYTGRLIIADIGIHPEYLREAASKSFYVTKDSVKPFLNSLPVFSHKGMAGHVLLIAGSKGTKGAAILAAGGCLRTGCGLLTLHSIPSLEQVLNVHYPSAMFSSCTNNNFPDTLPELDPYDAIAVGPGLGRNQETAILLKLLLQQCKVPLVLDADALNLLAENKTWLSFLPESCILTPHPGEFERLAGKTSNGYDRWQLQKEFSFKYGCTVVLKGAHTCVTTPDGKSFFNSTGNPGMAKGGSGDVLTGIIASLLARRLLVSEACIKAVYIHGSCGDLAAADLGEFPMLPTDMIGYLPMAILNLCTPP